jgi:hypothetical protein
MPRPRKETVDYFPHDCKHGKTMFILEQRYGNDGYAFWFKLLENLGSANGHFLKVESDADIEFLAALTKITAEQCIEILDLLAKLGAINAELWAQSIVWSDNFINRISEVYRKRESETPLPPVETPVSGVDNPQSKVEEIRVESSKEETTTSLPIDTGLAEIFKHYEETIKRIPSGKEVDAIIQLRDDYPLSSVLEAITTAVDANQPGSYALGILRNKETTFNTEKKVDKKPADIYGEYIPEENDYLDTLTIKGKEVQVTVFWDSILELLRTSVSAANFHAYLQNTYGFGIQGDTFAICVPDATKAGIIKRQLGQIIELKLSNETGRRMKLRCEVKE